MREARRGFASGCNVFVFIAWRTVANMKMLELNRPFLQFAKVFDLVFVQLADRPNGGALCNFVEPLNVFNASDYLVMIPSNDGTAMLARPIQYAHRMGIVSDQIATANNLVELSICVPEYRFQSVPIRM